MTSDFRLSSTSCIFVDETLFVLLTWSGYDPCPPGRAGGRGGGEIKRTVLLVGRCPHEASRAGFGGRAAGAVRGTPGTGGGEGEGASGGAEMPHGCFSLARGGARWVEGGVD